MGPPGVSCRGPGRCNVAGPTYLEVPIMANPPGLRNRRASPQPAPGAATRRTGQRWGNALAAARSSIGVERFGPEQGRPTVVAIWLEGACALEVVNPLAGDA